MFSQKISKIEKYKISIHIKNALVGKLNQNLHQRTIYFKAILVTYTKIVKYDPYDNKYTQ